MLKQIQYKGELSPKEASKGIDLAITNATELFKDAKLLYDNKSYARAEALAILSIEEIGKTIILRSILLEDNNSNLITLWKKYRNHIEKNKLWMFPTLMSALKGNLKYEHILWLVDPKNKKNSLKLEEQKQNSLYTDCIRKAEWTLPTKTVSKEEADNILDIAFILVNYSDNLAASEEHLELYKKHMKPILSADDNAKKKALMEFYKEAESKGILKRGDFIQAARRFLEE